MIPAVRETPAMTAFTDELRLAGFVEGQNIEIIPGGFDVRSDQLAEQAAAVVAASPDVIVCGPDNYARTLGQATRTIPILTMTEDIVAVGLVRSLARPAGNITGISLLSTELDGKRQDILLEAVPGARQIAALADFTASQLSHVKFLQDTARARGVELAVFNVVTPDDILPAIDAAMAGGAKAVNFLASPLFAVPGGPRTRAVIERVAALQLPSIYQWPENTDQGGLLGYGPSFIQVFRQRARQVARVLRGAKPTEIPVEQPTHFEFSINLKAAKAIGHEIPPGLVLRADRLIE